MKNIFIIFLSIAQQASYGQNLIINPSFEDTITFNPNNPYAYGPEAVPPWFTSWPSPDFLSESYYNGWFTYAPQNVFGYQFARTGIAYVGFAAYEPFEAIADRRELVSYTLSQPLIANHNYYLEFYVSCADSGMFAVDGMGAYFSIDTPLFYQTGLLNSLPIYNTLGNILNNTNGWQKISGNFIAQGGERVMTIGNLLHDNLLSVDTINPNAPVNMGVAYYFLDDVLLIDSTASGIISNEEPTYFFVNPNPVTDKLFIHMDSNTLAEAKLTISNTFGQEIWRQEFSSIVNFNGISVSEFSPGVYFLSVQTKTKYWGVKFIKK
jgi:hypothetical protein